MRARVSYPISVRFSRRDLEFVRRVADESDRSLGSVVRLALRRMSKVEEEEGSAARTKGQAETRST